MGVPAFGVSSWPTGGDVGTAVSGTFHVCTPSSPILPPTRNHTALVPACNDGDFLSVTAVIPSGSSPNAAPDHTPTPFSGSGSVGVVSVMVALFTTSTVTRSCYPPKKENIS